MPSEIAAASSKSVKTNWPFLPTTVAVPVSWHIGNFPADEITAFCNCV
jgi:hypothetical protein